MAASIFSFVPSWCSRGNRPSVRSSFHGPFPARVDESWRETGILHLPSSQDTVVQARARLFFCACLPRLPHSRSLTQHGASLPWECAKY